MSVSRPATPLLLARHETGCSTGDSALAEQIPTITEIPAELMRCQSCTLLQLSYTVPQRSASRPTTRTRQHNTSGPSGAADFQQLANALRMNELPNWPAILPCHRQRRPRRASSPSPGCASVNTVLCEENVCAARARSPPTRSAKPPPDSAQTYQDFFSAKTVRTGSGRDLFPG